MTSIRRKRVNITVYAMIEIGTGYHFIYFFGKLSNVMVSIWYSCDG